MARSFFGQKSTALDLISSFQHYNCEHTIYKVCTYNHTELESQFSNHYLKLTRFLELSKSRNQSDFEQHTVGSHKDQGKIPDFDFDGAK